MKLTKRDLLIGLAALGTSTIFAAIPVVDFRAAQGTLRLEFLEDSLVHFEVTAHGASTGRIPTSPMIVRSAFPGAVISQERATITTQSLTITVDPQSLCFTVTDRRRERRLTQVCPRNLTSDWKGLTFTAEATRNLYGLGEAFRRPGHTDGDWMHDVRTPGEINGNAMEPFNRGHNGNVQIPILYALDESASYGFFLDSTYKQQWDFRNDPWTVDTWGDTVRGFIFTGADLPALRYTYLDLVGHPLVPPKKIFGLWVSEYGFRNWAEMESKLVTLRRHHFPVDGFMLDLYWYGGIIGDSDNSAMGKMTWDTENFPNARAHLKTWRDRDGIGLIPIEEPYVARNLAEHRELAQRGYLVKDPNGAPAYLTDNSWWGKGALIDWSNPPANDCWHRAKRVSLIEDGITGIWTDLGEPELYPGDGRYFGGREANVHNLFNFYWLRGIYEGYRKYSPSVRPFMLSRSGTAGIQRFGAGMWSGDIGSDLTNLAAHLNAQMHLSLSGIDYYGADIGGFKREALVGDLKEMYTQWFADGTLFDVPVRPHTENLCHCKETAPDRVGDLASNLQNLQQRYALIPYLYSLAHRAHLAGEPLFPPLVYYYEKDPAVRELAGEKMIGAWLLARAVAQNGAKAIDVYLPAGRWFEFHDDGLVVSSGQTLKQVSLYRDGKLTPPVYARSGAIIPLMAVDGQTMNALGRRLDGSQNGELRARIYPDTMVSHFDLYEDDGESTAYLTNGVRRTPLTQQLVGNTLRVTIGGADGTFVGAPSTRDTVLEIVAPGTVAAVSLNGNTLPRHHPRSTGAGWSMRQGRLVIHTGLLSVSEEKRIVVERN